MPNTALLVVDMLNDFVDERGSLPVKDATSIVERINKIAQFGFKPREKYKVILSMQDLHGVGHCSFVENGGKFPTHCVKNTWGADVYPKLRLKDYFNIYKATNDDAEGFGGFVDSKGCETDALAVLRMIGATEVHVVGVAAEFCVKETILQAVDYGFDTYFIPKCIKGISENSTRDAYREMNRVARPLDMVTIDGRLILQGWDIE
jgi:nicotinamidase/pyrazinamidase